jgi:hypothetical protein
MRAEWSECRRAAEERDELSSPHDPLRETALAVLCNAHLQFIASACRHSSKMTRNRSLPIDIAITAAAGSLRRQSLAPPVAAAAGTYAART